MPLLRNRDKSKISKRKNPTSLLWYRDAGYLPEALVNFLALMGYSPPPRSLEEGENPEIFSFAQMVRDFDLSRVKTSGPVFDLGKLDSFNGAYIRMMHLPACVDRLISFVAYLRERAEDFSQEPLPKKGDLADREQARRRQIEETLAFWDRWEPSRERLVAIMPVLQERLTTFLDFAGKAAFFFEEKLEYDSAGLVSKNVSPAAVADALTEAARRLAQPDAFDEDSVETAARSLPEDLGLKAKPLFMALRVAVTGSKVSPPLFQSMVLLGRETVIARLRIGADRARTL